MPPGPPGATRCTYPLTGRRTRQLAALPASGRPVPALPSRTSPAPRSARLLALRCSASSGDAVRVRFSTQRKVKFGEVLRLVGSHPTLGNWKVGSQHAALDLWQQGLPCGIAGLACEECAPLCAAYPAEIPACLGISWPRCTCSATTVACRQVDKAPWMAWEDGHVWSAEVSLPPGTTVEFKASERLC